MRHESHLRNLKNFSSQKFRIILILSAGNLGFSITSYHACLQLFFLAYRPKADLETFEISRIQSRFSQNSNFFHSCARYKGRKCNKKGSKIKDFNRNLVISMGNFSCVLHREPLERELKRKNCHNFLGDETKD